MACSQRGGRCAWCGSGAMCCHPSGDQAWNSAECAGVTHTYGDYHACVDVGPLALLVLNETHPALAYNASAADGNPLKGFIASPEWSAWPYQQDIRSSLEFYYVPLRAVMDTDSSFAGFDSYLEPRLAASAARGMQVVLRFHLDYPGTCSYDCAVPQYLIDGGLAFRSYSEHGGGRSPDYSSEALLSALERFIAALGTR